MAAYRTGQALLRLSGCVSSPLEPLGWAASIEPHLSSEVPGASSDLLHYDVVCVLRESTESAKVRGEHRSARLGQGDYERIDCGASPCPSPQQRSSPCQRFADLLHDVARLEKTVREGVAARMPVQTLH